MAKLTEAHPNTDTDGVPDLETLRDNIASLKAMADALAHDVEIACDDVARETGGDLSLIDRVAPLPRNAKDMPLSEARRSLGILRRRIRLDREGVVLRERTQTLRRQLDALSESSVLLLAHSRRVRQSCAPLRDAGLGIATESLGLSNEQRTEQDLQALREQHREALRAWSEQAAHQRERALQWARQVSRLRGGNSR